MDTPPTLHERLKFAMRHADKTHAQLAETLDKARSAVTHWCTGRNEPDRGDIERIAEELHVRAAWLAFGDGPMVEVASPIPHTANDFTVNPSTPHAA